MKKTMSLVLLMGLFFCTTLRGAESIKYTFLLNEVPEDFSLPMVGLINMGHGNQQTFQVGLLNTIGRNLEGAQFGFINNVGRDMRGLQAGFINTTEHDQFGIQAGFINAVDNNFQGLEMGFINAIGDRMQGIQTGFINAVEKMEGFQIGFINATENLKGFQIGFINAAERTLGSQVGFVNATAVLDGLQIGFINRVGRVAHGMPIGFLSFVKHGGFKAMEFRFNEMFPYNLSYKTGVDNFYTFPILSYNPNASRTWAIGFGAGSIVPMNEEVFFNPELMSQNVLTGDFEQITSLVLNFGHTFTDRLDFLGGPSLVWNRTNAYNPLFSLRDWDLNGNNRLHLGVSASIRYRF